MKWWSCSILALALLSGCGRKDAGEENWIVMGTTASVRWEGIGDAEGRCIAGGVREAFAEVERLLDAHDPASELSRLAKCPDAEILARCSPSVRECYAAAFLLRDQTGGAFNPRWKGAGTMDLGAIAKGFAVDAAVRGMRTEGFSGRWRILVDLGGNLKAVGTRGWNVGIRDGGSFALAPGQACATSAEYFRGRHIRDGRTGGSVSNGVYSVTVVHPASAMMADGLSTAMFVLGKSEGGSFIARHHREARAMFY